MNSNSKVDSYRDSDLYNYNTRLRNSHILLKFVGVNYLHIGFPMELNADSGLNLAG